MASAFSVSSRSSEDHVDVRPPEQHLLPYMTGGLKTFLCRIKTKDHPRQTGSGYFTSKDGHFELKGPCMIGGRFKVIKVLNTNGQSAVLVLAEDEFDQEKLVVIKILHSQFYQIGVQESHILARLAAIDPLNISHTLRLQTTVMCDSHYCLVFEPLLPDPITTVFSEIPQHNVLANIKKVGLRLLASVGFLHHHNMIHTDLKPENLLLRDEDDFDSVHIVDFGNTLQYVHSELSLYYKDFELQTPLYRAPEVLFGVPFGKEIDMWSLGCILAELYLGETLFFGYTIIDIIGKIKNILGPFPSSLFRKGKYYRKYQEFTGDEKPENNTLRLMECLQCKDVQFADLLAGLLHYDPSERLTASEAACHPFFASHFPLAFLLSNKTDHVRNTTKGLCPPSCPSSPYIARDISRRPTSLELLRMGTSELSDMNETYILKPSPKVGIVKRGSATESMSSTHETSDEDLNTTQDVCLPGPADMSIVRNLVQGRKKTNLSRSVKEKMSDLLKAIREEQDLVEADLDRRDVKQQQYDKHTHDKIADKDSVYRNTRGTGTCFVGPICTTNIDKSSLIQPRPKYGKVGNENEMKDKLKTDTGAESEYIEEKEEHQQDYKTRKYENNIKHHHEHEQVNHHIVNRLSHRMIPKPSPKYKNEMVKNTSPKSPSEFDDEMIERKCFAKYPESLKKSHRQKSPSQIRGFKTEEENDNVSRKDVRNRFMENTKRKSGEVRSSEIDCYKTDSTRHSDIDEAFYGSHKSGLSSNHASVNSINDRNRHVFEQNYKGGRAKSHNSIDDDENDEDMGNKMMANTRKTDSYLLQNNFEMKNYISSTFARRHLTSGQYRTDIECFQSGIDVHTKDPDIQRYEKSSNLTETNISSMSDEDSSEIHTLSNKTVKYNSVNSGSKNRRNDLDRLEDSLVKTSERKNKSRPLVARNYTSQHRSASSTSTMTYAESQSSEECVELLSPGVATAVQPRLKPPSASKHLSSAVHVRNPEVYERKKHTEKPLFSPRYQNNQYLSDQHRHKSLPVTSSGRKDFVENDLQKYTKDVYSRKGQDECRYDFDFKERDRKRNTKRKLDMPHVQETENTYVVHQTSQVKKQKPLNNEMTYGLSKNHLYKEDDLMVSKNRKTHKKFTINSGCTQQKNPSAGSLDREGNMGQPKDKPPVSIRWYSSRERQDER